MKTKIVGMLVCMLLISTAMATIAVSKNNLKYNESGNYEPVLVPLRWLKGADQYQTTHVSYGMVVAPEFHVAQEFKPTKEDLTAVALKFFDKNAANNTEITVAIRDSLNGTDLINITIDADSKNIKQDGTWVMFDFDDITVVPEETYYIICYASDGIVNFCYCWFFDVENKYERGKGWSSEFGGPWTDLEDPGWGPEFLKLDLCFITYYQPPPKSSTYSYQMINWLINRFPNAFPILRIILEI